jgi:hypothetical protein
MAATVKCIYIFSWDMRNADIILFAGMIFFSYLTDFSIFLYKKNIRKLPDTVRTGKKKYLFERGCRWFILFFIDFQLFHFLTRIIPVFDIIP